MTPTMTFPQSVTGFPRPTDFAAAAHIFFDGKSLFSLLATSIDSHDFISKIIRKKKKRRESFPLVGRRKLFCITARSMLAPFVYQQNPTFTT